MPNYSALKAAIGAAPYAGETDEAIISALNALTVPTAAYVQTSAIAAYLGTQGKLSALIKWAASPPSGASALSIVAAEELAFAFQNPGTIAGFDMTNAATAGGMEAFLAALVDPGSGVAGPLVAADQAAILALASTMTCPAAAYGFPGGVTAGDLQTARAQP